MALRDQPYLPLYVQDFLTDEKLIECSAAAHGVYIRIMCLMHKSTTYGKILLRRLPDGLPRQNERQNKIFADLFADQLVKQLPFKEPEISAALEELLTEGVLKIEDNFLVQKRMVNDNELSIKRSKAGKRGADTTNAKNVAVVFAAAKGAANAEYENEYNKETVDIGKAESKGESKGTIVQEDETTPATDNALIAPKMITVFKKAFPDYYMEPYQDLSACLEIAYKIASKNGWKKSSVTNGKMQDCIEEWERIVEFIKGDKWYRNKNITYLNKDYQSLIQTMNNNGKSKENRFIAGKTKPVWNTGTRTGTVSVD